MTAQIIRFPGKYKSPAERSFDESLDRQIQNLERIFEYPENEREERLQKLLGFKVRIGPKA